MDANLQQTCRDLRRLSSQDALAWLLDRYPAKSCNAGKALRIIGHRSWAKREHDALYAAYFPLALVSTRPLEVFTAFMSPTALLRRIAAGLEDVPADDRRTTELTGYRLHWFRGRLPLSVEEAILLPLLAKLGDRTPK